MWGVMGAVHFRVNCWHKEIRLSQKGRFLNLRSSISAVLLMLALALLSVPYASAQRPSGNENQFSVSQTLFATLAAINAAGYNTGIDAAINDKFKLRTEIRQELAKRKIPSLPEMKDFYAAPSKPSGGARSSANTYPSRCGWRRAQIRTARRRLAIRR